MKKVNFFVMLAAALMMGVTSCNNDDGADGDGGVAGGQPTAMGLTIKAPRAPHTYASDDPNATDDEIKLNKVNVLIYGETSSGSGSYILEKNAPLTMSDFDLVPGAHDIYTLKDASKISTTTGNKRIHVAMNYPGTFPAMNDNLAGLANLVYTLPTADDLSSPTNGLAMFSAEAKDAALVPETTPGETPAANKMTITVKRLVAKITVQEDIPRTNGDIISQGGKLTNLQFAVGNANKTIFPLQKRVGTSPNIVIQDNNWDTYAPGDFFAISDYGLASTDYQSIDAAATGVLLLNTAYAPENTAKTYNADGENLTFLSVRTQYQPEFFVDGIGTSKGPNTDPAKSFWTVTKTDGAIMYFDVESEADTYTGANAGTVKSAEYIDGLCYYRAYLNKNSVADGNILGSVAAKFDVLRNNYYKAMIHSIKAPGAATDEGKVTEETSLMVNVEVEAWFAVSDDYDL